MKTIKIIFLFLFMTVFSIGINSQMQVESVLLPACEKQNKCGFIDLTGKIFIKPKFVSAGEFSEGLARVQVEIEESKKWGFIDKTGKIVIEAQFDLVWDFSEGLARFQTDENIFEYGFIDKTGKVVIEPKLSGAIDFSEGLARISVQQKTDSDSATPDKKVYKSCFINKKGEIVISCDFDEVSDFSEDLAVAFVNKRAGFIDKNGKWVIEPVFIDAKSFSEGLAAVEGINSKGERGWGYINKNGDVVIGPQYSDVSSFSEGLAAVKVTQYGNYGYINHFGKVVIPFKFSSKPSDFSDGLADIYVGNNNEYAPRYAYIDRTGNRISRKTYSYAFPFKNGIAFVGKQNYFEKIFAVTVGLYSGTEYYINKFEKVIWKEKGQ